MNNKVEDLLRPLFYFIKDVIDFNGKRRLSRNIELYNRHTGNRGFLLCTGESLEHINILQLKKEYTFGINLFFCHEDFIELDLSYYVFLDTDRNLYPGMPQWPKNYLGELGQNPMRQIYFELDKRINTTTQLILNSECFKYTKDLFLDNIVFFSKVKKDLKVVNGVSAKTIADMTKRCLSGGGSIYFTILIMIYMGFKQIYLIGAGYSYSPEYLLHFYDNIILPMSIGKDEAELKIKEVIFTHNRKYNGSLEYYGLLEKNNYYRGISISKKNENNPKHYAEHRKIKKYAESIGVKIVNIIPAGFESPVYEKISWDIVANEVLQKK